METISLAISLWTRIEFASVMARDAGTGSLPGESAKLLLDEFDHVAASSLHILSPMAADFELAPPFTRGFSIHLRGPNALHLAIARNHRVPGYCPWMGVCYAPPGGYPSTPFGE